MRLLLFSCLIGAALSAPAQEIWTASLGAPAAHAPLVADINEAPGPEVVAVLTTGQIRAFQADGSALWTTDLAAPVAPGAQSALSEKSDSSPATLAVPAATGIRLLNASTGALLWKTDAPIATWLLIADLDDDKTPDIVAASADGTLSALNGTDGAPLWEAEAKRSALAGPPALADIDDDGFPELFVAGREGLLILDAQGEELSFVELPGGALSAPVVGDVDDDGRFEVYVVLAGGTLAAHEADSGELLWETKLSMPDAPAPALALADLDQDEQGEILVAGARTTVVAADGKVLFESAISGHGPTIADANSDGELEIALAGAKLTLLDAALGPVSEITLPSPARFAPVVAAIGGASVLSMGEDDTLRATRTGARLMPQLAPWAQPRRDATARAASLSPLLEQDRHADGPQLAASNAALAFATGFEDAAVVWPVEGGTAVQDTALKSSGNASLKLTPSAAAPLRTTSATVDIPPSLRRVSASLVGKDIASAQLVWQRADGTPVTRDLKPADTTPEGWQRYRISNAPKPAGARTLHMAVTVSTADGTPAYIDDVQASGEHQGVPYVELFCNLVGYELRAPKRFTAAATFPTASATFRVLNEQGGVVHESGMGAPSQVVGAYNTDWGKFYWRGDFTTVDEPGKYRLEINIDGNTAQSPVIEIGPDLLWERLFTPLVSALASMRADAESYRAWRSADPLDDIAALRALNEIYSMISWRLPKSESGADHPLLQEIQWGADRLLLRTEPGPPLAAALAGTARLLPANAAYTDAARKLFAAHAQDESAKLDLFCAALDLYVATRDEALMAEAKRLYPGAEATVIDGLVRYEGQIDDMLATSFAASAVLGEKSDAAFALADNAFGIAPRDDAGVKNFLNTPAKDAPAVATGNLDQILDVANTAAKVYRFNAKLEYQTLVLDQFNWILGNNPFGVSLFSGLGVPEVKGIPGTVGDAIRAVAPGVDRPALYQEPSASALRQTIACLEVLANLKRIRTAAPPQP